MNRRLTIFTLFAAPLRYTSFVTEETRIELAGFIYEAHTEYKVISVRQANLINADRTIEPPPIEASRNG